MQKAQGLVCARIFFFREKSAEALELKNRQVPLEFEKFVGIVQRVFQREALVTDN